ncbi:hypothetical protein Salat_1487000 [Sesamum alatum]|uniref:Uncharacterized protein n=1 Tax=Sesamum alatum TaxID=300844 RepID=A0AAE1YBF1_9LAMI|nr:hypothetical protein Salat_1487000 [Sesamum alatum]
MHSKTLPFSQYPTPEPLDRPPGSNNRVYSLLALTGYVDGPLLSPRAAKNVFVATDECWDIGKAQDEGGRNPPTGIENLPTQSNAEDDGVECSRKGSIDKGKVVLDDSSSRNCEPSRFVPPSKDIVWQASRQRN